MGTEWNRAIKYIGAVADLATTNHIWAIRVTGVPHARNRAQN